MKQHNLFGEEFEKKEECQMLISIAELIQKAFIP